MLTVKIFDEEHENDLEESIDHFIQSSDGLIEIEDIQFRVTVAEDSLGDQVFCFSAMVVYQQKRSETTSIRKKRSTI